MSKNWHLCVVDAAKMSRVLSYPPKDHNLPVDTRHVLIYFMSGNPGLIEYYTPFLSTLHTLLETSASNRPRPRPVAVHIHGSNLAGFDDNDHDKPFTPSNPPHNLEFQIEYVLSNLASVKVQVEGPRYGTPFDDVIVMGHSVGSFLTLEVFNRHLHGEIETVHLRAGILLFPTVTDIAKSPSGRRLDLIRSSSFLDSNAHRIAKGFVDLVPAAALGWIVRRILGFPKQAAEVTVRFLKSRDGIWQAIHMGKDEMKVIGEETWKEELWEIADEAVAEGCNVPKFYFYYGRGDDWVADECRDEFIAKRNEHAEREGPKHKRGRTKIVVDEDDVPHAFCISESLPAILPDKGPYTNRRLRPDHSEQVAEKVKVWIDEILDSLRSE